MGKYPFSDDQDKRRQERRPNRKDNYYRMPAKSEELTEDLKIYEVLSKGYLLDHPICECCGRRWSVDIHHKKGRGIFLNVVEFFLAVCRECHDYIEEHPKWARAKGYSLSRLSNDDSKSEVPDEGSSELPFKE